MDKTKIKRKCPACGKNLALSKFSPGSGIEVWYCKTEYKDKDGHIIGFCPKWGQSKLFESKKMAHAH